MCVDGRIAGMDPERRSEPLAVGVLILCSEDAKRRFRNRKRGRLWGKRRKIKSSLPPSYMGVLDCQHIADCRISCGGARRRLGQIRSAGLMGKRRRIVFTDDVLV